MMKRREKICFALTLLMAASAFVLSVCVGKYPISPAKIPALLFSADNGGMEQKVLYTLRLPRAIMGMASGFCLGMAGSVYQGVFRNPLASPDVIGVASGANLGAAIAIVLGGGVWSVAGGAFAGSILALGLVLLLVRSTGMRNVAGYVLSGMILSAAARAILMLIKYFADYTHQLQAIEFWTMGSLGGVTAEKLWVALPGMAFGMVGVTLLRRQIAMLALEDDESRSLGVRLHWVRGAALALSTVMVSASVAVTGLISFVGLIAPHCAALLLGKRSFSSGVLGGLLGAILLTLADCLARSLHTSEMPISILTTLIGVPFLIYLMTAERWRRR